MKKIIYILPLLLLIACSGNSNNNSEPIDEWYAGGTLHKSIIGEWKSATVKDKLATCADYVANVKDYAGDMDAMKKDATDVMDCINETVIGDELISSKTVEVASSCVLLLGIAN